MRLLENFWCGRWRLTIPRRRVYNLEVADGQPIKLRGADRHSFRRPLPVHQRLLQFASMAPCTRLEKPGSLRMENGLNGHLGSGQYQSVTCLNWCSTCLALLLILSTA